VALAVSLHAPDDALRDRWCRSTASTRSRTAGGLPRYLERAPRDFITFEYVMLDGVNDSPRRRARWSPHARRALQVQPDPVQPVSRRRASSADASASGLRADRAAGRGFVTTVRKTRGDDIDAACGQLAGEVSGSRWRGPRVTCARRRNWPPSCVPGSRAPRKPDCWPVGHSMSDDIDALASAEAQPAAAALPPAAFGERLKWERERAGLTVSDVAARLRLHPNQIRALEQESFAKLPEAAYVRGFVRSYTRIFNVDAAPLLDDLATKLGPTAGSVVDGMSRARDYSPVQAAAREQASRAATRR
jgi:transcriptional regulator with XRE-family HTH domain